MQENIKVFKNNIFSNTGSLSPSPSMAPSSFNDDAMVYDVGGVPLTGESLHTLMPSTYPLNNEGGITVNYTTSILSNFNQSFYNESMFNLTGMIAFDENHNLTEWLSEQASAWSKGGITFQEVDEKNIINPNNILQVAECPSLSEGLLGFATLSEKDDEVTGARVCIKNKNDKETFSHEIGHSLGYLVHPDQNQNITDAFSRSGYSTENGSIMHSSDSKASRHFETKRPEYPTEFDQDVFSIRTFGEDRDIHLPEPYNNRGIAIAGMTFGAVLLCAIGASEVINGAIKARKRHLNTENNRDQPFPACEITRIDERVQDNSDIEMANEVKSDTKRYEGLELTIMQSKLRRDGERYPSRDVGRRDASRPSIYADIGEGYWRSNVLNRRQSSYEKQVG